MARDPDGDGDGAGHDERELGDRDEPGHVVKVAVACVAAKEGYFVSRMNRAPRRNMRVAWLVIN